MNSKLFLPSICLVSFIAFFGTCNKFGQKREADWAEKMAKSPVPNYYKINDSLYRSAQPGKTGFNYLQQNGFKSILNLRDDQSDSAILSGTHLQPFRVPITTAAFTEDDIITALLFLKIAPKPLLVHCKHGADRTGAVIAMFRIIFQNWTKEQAITEMVNGGYGFHTRYQNILRLIRQADIEKIKKALSN